LALLLMLVLALPLFLLKIEKIPPELFWLLSVIFVVLGWPARFAWGWAYRYAQPRQDRAARKIRWPVGIFTAAIALTFAFIFFLTRYTSWNGTLSLFENHVFLLPLPFWF
jgi:predicted cation transporter